MTIVNGYATKAKFQIYISTYATGTTADELTRILNDDSQIDDLITDASRVIDGVTGRQFYIATGTFYYDYTNSDLIFFDKDIWGVVSVTNGDGTSIAANQYNLLPVNGSPKYAIELKSGIEWQMDSSGNARGVITVVAAEGFNSAVPADIELACLIIAVSLYRQRNGEAPLEGGFVTPSGVRIISGGIPKTAATILARYTKRTFGSA